MAPPCSPPPAAGNEREVDEVGCSCRATLAPAAQGRLARERQGQGLAPRRNQLGERGLDEDRAAKAVGHDQARTVGEYTSARRPLGSGASSSGA